MPNHVLNRITPECSEDRRKEILEAVKSDEAGYGSIDFMKIIPMPNSLSIESGSLTQTALELYEQYRKASDKAEDDGKEDARERFLESIADSCPDAENLLEMGRQYSENLEKYGHATWYEWCIDNWGTKWNAYDFDVVSPKNDVNGMIFHTAWSAAIPILEKLSTMYPDVPFNLEFADEDIGYNLGTLTVKDGQVTEEYFPTGGSLEAYKMYEEITGEQLEDIGFVYSEKSENYEWPEDTADEASQIGKPKVNTQER